MECEEFVDFKREIQSQLIGLNDSLRQMHGENNNIRNRLDRLETSCTYNPNMQPISTWLDGLGCWVKADDDGSPPSLWDQATHGRIRGCVNIYEISNKTETQITLGKCVQCNDGCPDDTPYIEYKFNLIPLLERSTPGRKKGEFVEHSMTDYGATKLYRKLEADEPDRVTYINLETGEEV